jgi:hypothetical protein
MIAIVLLVALVVLGVAAVTGILPDSRDSRFGVGPLLRRRGSRDTFGSTISRRACRLPNETSAR